MMNYDALAALSEVARTATSGGIPPIQMGIVQDYSPEDGTVVVNLFPDNVATGDIPLLTPWAGTPGTPSGFQAGPSKDTLVLVFSLDTTGQQRVALPAMFSSKNAPPVVPTDEAWLFHKDPKNYFKLQNDNKTKISGGVAVQVIAPTVELSDGLSMLGGDDAIVRKANLQVVVDYINGLVNLLKSGPFLSTFSGSPVLPGPAMVAHLPASPATASSVGKAKG